MIIVIVNLIIRVLSYCWQQLSKVILLWQFWKFGYCP